jgi:hypothetical protein
MLCDQDRLALTDMLAQLACETVRVSWGRIVATCDRALTLDALDSLIAARDAVRTLVNKEVPDYVPPDNP